MQESTGLVSKITMFQFRMMPSIAVNVLAQYLHEVGAMTGEEFELISKFGADIDFDGSGRLVLDLKEPSERVVLSKG